MNFWRQQKISVVVQGVKAPGFQEEVFLTRNSVYPLYVWAVTSSHAIISNQWPFVPVTSRALGHVSEFKVDT